MSFSERGPKPEPRTPETNPSFDYDTSEGARAYLAWYKKSVDDPNIEFDDWKSLMSTHKELIAAHPQIRLQSLLIREEAGKLMSGDKTEIQSLRDQLEPGHQVSRYEEYLVEARADLKGAKATARKLPTMRNRDRVKRIEKDIADLEQDIAKIKKELGDPEG